jgi:glyoxylase-like metal-dependent hydrolase (beta-lactamase superfamily II)
MDMIKPMVEGTRKVLMPLRDRMAFIKDGQDVVSGIKAVASPGHTVGHTSFLITSGDQTLCVTGDVLHHHVPFLTFHFPWPGLGHVTKAGKGFRYIAAPMQMVL